MTTPERHLVLFLRLSAVMFLCAAPFVFVPTAWMRGIAADLGLEMPDLPLLQYLTRMVSAVYAMLGASYWYMSTDVRRYLPLLRFGALVTIVFDIVIVAVDALIPMPLSWTISEAVSLGIWTVVMLWLVRRVSAHLE